MRYQIKGLQHLNRKVTETRLAELHGGDIVAYGCETALTETHSLLNPAYVEAKAVSRLCSAMLAACCEQGVIWIAPTFSKLCIADSALDLIPELENLDFETGEAIYIIISDN